MQATVSTFDLESHAGAALRDDGHEVTFSGDVFDDSGLRHVRPGQRVSVVLAPDRRTVTRLWIVGVGEDEFIR